MAPFLLKNTQFSELLGEEGSKEGISLLWFSPWKRTPVVSLLWQGQQSAKTEDEPCLPLQNKKICYSKCQLIPSKKLQRSQMRCPSLNSPANVRCFTTVLPTRCSRHCCCVQHPDNGGNAIKKTCILSRATLLGDHVQELSQPLQDRISPLLATWLPDRRQHFALGRFNEIQKKKTNFFLFLFNILVYFCQFWAFGLSLV